MVAFARSVGAALFGVDARLVDIQVSVPGGGEHGVFRLVGMADGALREGKERIRGAIVHTGYAWPEGTLTVNLAPASARKEGPSLDLPIALAILQACGSVGRAEVLGRTLCIGELTLDGRVRPVRGCSRRSRRRGHRAREALVLTQRRGGRRGPGVVVRAVDTLAEAVGAPAGTARLAPSRPRRGRPTRTTRPPWTRCGARPWPCAPRSSRRRGGTTCC
jgi:magnesium chelatase family protein